MPPVLTVYFDVRRIACRGRGTSRCDENMARHKALRGELATRSVLIPRIEPPTHVQPIYINTVCSVSCVG